MNTKYYLIIPIIIISLLSANTNVKKEGLDNGYYFKNANLSFGTGINFAYGAWTPIAQWQIEVIHAQNVDFGIGGLLGIGLSDLNNMNLFFNAKLGLCSTAKGHHLGVYLGSSMDYFFNFYKNFYGFLSIGLIGDTGGQASIPCLIGVKFIW